MFLMFKSSENEREIKQESSDKSRDLKGFKGMSSEKATRTSKEQIEKSSTNQARNQMRNQARNILNAPRNK